MSVPARNTARSRVLRALEGAGSRGCTNAELCRPDCGGNRFGARLKELRDEGHRIRGHRVGQGQFRYFLLRPGAHDPVEDAGGPPAVGVLGTDRPRFKRSQARRCQVITATGYRWEPHNPRPEEYLSESEFLAAAERECEARKVAA